MSGNAKRKRRSFSGEFKQSAVELVVKQGYSFRVANDAVEVDFPGVSSLAGEGQTPSQTAPSTARVDPQRYPSLSRIRPIAISSPMATQKNQSGDKEVTPIMIHFPSSSSIT